MQVQTSSLLYIVDWNDTCTTVRYTTGIVPIWILKKMGDVKDTPFYKNWNKKKRTIKNKAEIFLVLQNCLCIFFKTY